MRVTLKRHELFMGAQAGVMRRLEAMRHGREDRYGAPPQDLWGLDIEACLAELAVAKAYNLYWERLARNPAALRGDVAELQVRSTWREDGSLILHHEDPDDAIFILVTGRAPTFDIRGWIRGSDGKEERWWRTGDGRPAFFVPQSALNRASPPREGSVTVGPWPGSKSTTTGSSSR
jgi:hypothetical protein